MATDLETLVVQMSADFKSYENAFAKATGITKQQLAVIKGEAANTGKVAAVALDGATRGVQKFGQQAQTSVRGVQNLRLQTGNLAAQFQDIAVQLQSGTPLYTIALQQGTQISSVLGGGGAAGAVKALGAAFASVISPLSLVSIGLIVAGGAAVRYFASLFDGGAKSEAELEKQSQLIQQIANDWRDTVPSLAAYADKLKEAREEAELLQGIKIAQEGIGEGVIAEFEALTDTLTETLHLVPDANREFGVLAGKVASGAATTEDYQRVIDAFNDSIFASEAVIQAAVAALASMQDRAIGAAIEIRTLGTEAEIAAGKMLSAFQGMEQMRRSAQTAPDPTDSAIDAMNAENAATSEQIALQQELADVKSKAPLIGDREGLAQAEANLAAAARRKAEDAAAREAARSSGGGGSDKAAKEAEREREAVKKLIEQLEFELTLIGQTAAEKERLNALRRAGAAATPKEVERIEELVAANYAEIEALQKTEDQMNRLKDVSRDVLGGLFEDLRDGVAAADLLNNALNRVIESMTQTALDQFVEGVFAGQTTPMTGGLLGGRIIPGVLHAGGVAGQGGGSTRAYPAAMWANAPRFHSGGEVPALLLPGERVLSKRESAGYGGDVTVQVFNAPAGTQVQESKGPDGKRLIKVMLKPALQELMSDGSMDGTMRSNFGVRRRPR